MLGKVPLWRPTEKAPIALELPSSCQASGQQAPHLLWVAVDATARQLQALLK